jgi:hypothetical protein
MVVYKFAGQNGGSVVCLLSMKPHFLLPPIPEEQQSPLVWQLLDIIDQQAHLTEQMAEQIQQLKDEIARLKNQPPRPKIQPSRLEKKRSKKHKSSKAKRPGSAKRQKTAELEIHDTQPIEPEYLPHGSALWMPSHTCRQTNCHSMSWNQSLPI